MKGKYISSQILLACLSTTGTLKSDIHKELRETILVHKKIMARLLESLSGNEHPFIPAQKKAA